MHNAIKMTTKEFFDQVEDNSVIVEISDINVVKVKHCVSTHTKPIIVSDD